MDAGTAATGVAALVAFLGLLWGIIRHVIQKHETNMDDKFKDVRRDLGDKIDQVRATTAANARNIQETRDQLHTDYVRQEQLDKSINDLNMIVSKLFDKVDKMSKDLNQFIGLIKARSNSD